MFFLNLLSAIRQVHSSYYTCSPCACKAGKPVLVFPEFSLIQNRQIITNFHQRCRKTCIFHEYSRKEAVLMSGSFPATLNLHWPHWNKGIALKHKKWWTTVNNQGLVVKNRRISKQHRDFYTTKEDLQMLDDPHFEDKDELMSDDS